MSEADDMLRDMAENRGCKLVRSRVRTPGRGDYGRFGLKDAKSGKEVLGFGRKGLTATAEQVETFLRGGTASAWKSSVGKTPARKQIAAKVAPAPRPKAEPRLVIRDARPKDIDALVGLIVALGYEVTAAEVRTRLARLRKAGQHVLVADRGGAIGLLTTSIMHVLHRPRPVGRISMMVVAEAARSGGVGAALVAEAEARLEADGCGLVEVTSNAKRLRAHAFYERLGYERTSIRLAKQIQE